MREAEKLQASFKSWHSEAKPGDRVVYHIGPHAGGAICREFMDASDAGLVILMRKRAENPHHFYYIAQKAKT